MAWTYKYKEIVEGKDCSKFCSAPSTKDYTAWNFLRNTKPSCEYVKDYMAFLTSCGRRLFVIYRTDWKDIPIPPEHEDVYKSYRNWDLKAFENINELSDRWDDYGLSLIAVWLSPEGEYLSAISRYDRYFKHGATVPLKVLNKLLGMRLAQFLDFEKKTDKRTALEYIKPKLSQLAAKGVLQKAFGNLFKFGIGGWGAVSFMGGELGEKFPYMGFINKGGEVLNDALYDNPKEIYNFFKFGSKTVSIVTIKGKRWLIGMDGAPIHPRGFDSIGGSRCKDWIVDTAGRILVSNNSPSKSMDYGDTRMNIMNDDGELLLPFFVPNINGTCNEGECGRSYNGYAEVWLPDDAERFSNIYDFNREEFVFDEKVGIINSCWGGAYKPVAENAADPRDDVILVKGTSSCPHGTGYNFYLLPERRWFSDEWGTQFYTYNLKKSPQGTVGLDIPGKGIVMFDIHGNKI